MEQDTGRYEEGKAGPAARTRGRLTAVIVIIFAAVLFGFYESRSPASAPEGGGIFTVLPGASLKSVGTDLSAAHYIHSRVLFSTLVTFFGSEHSISPGDYAFSAHESTLGIARQIATGSHHLDPIKVTVPEGDTVSDIGDILAKKLPAFDTAEFNMSAKGDEGYLFPETYFFYPKTTSAEIVKEMRAMFDKQTDALFGASNVSPKPGRSKADIVTMASLVEREAHGDDDRAMIAGILWKRLDLGMALQVDSTVAYAAGVPDNMLSKKDFAVDSPYNTYKYKGLPPGPIANPGLQALTAAFDPAATSYLYYLHDSHGTIHYAKTYAEHLANIAKYLK